MIRPTAFPVAGSINPITRLMRLPPVGVPTAREHAGCHRTDGAPPFPLEKTRSSSVSQVPYLTAAFPSLALREPKFQLEGAQ